jgi:tight adherence protein B
MRRALLTAVVLLGLAVPAHGAGVRIAERAAWPQRELSLSLPDRRRLDPAQVKITENGKPVTGVRITSGVNDGKRGVLLAVDASRSMRGEPIIAALEAARRLAANRPEGVPFGVVFFARSPHLKLAPTTDAAEIEDALAVGPRLSTGSNIAGAARAGLRALDDAGLTDKTLVLLSDGAQIPRAPVPANLDGRIYSVGLRSKDFKPGMLDALAQRTGGESVTAADPAQLPALLGSIGQGLTAQYRVSYQSLVPAGADVRVRVSVAGSAPAHAAYQAPDLPGDAAAGAPAKETSTAAIVAIALGAFVLVALLVLLVLRSGRKTVVDRISAFAGGGGGPLTAATRDRTPASPLDEKLLMIGSRLNAVQLRLAVAAAMLVLVVYFAVIDKPALAVFALAVPVAVWVWLSSRIAARRVAFSDQLPDNLQMLASALRAGHSLSSALGSIADDAPEPSRAEFRRAATDEQLGVPIDEALAAMGTRMENEEIEYVGVVAKLQRDTGGNTAEILDRVVETIRERHQLKRMVRTLTAQSRLGAVIISLMPIVVAFGMSVLHPGYFDPMLESSVGIGLILAGVVMLCTGWAVIRKIVNLEG